MRSKFFPIAILVMVLGVGTTLLRGSAARPGLFSDANDALEVFGEDAYPDNYIHFTDTAIAETEGTKIVYFHADWCLTCNAFQNNIISEGIPADVTFIKADYDQELDLRQKYGVNFQTFTVLIDDDGNLVETHYAGTEPKVSAVLDHFGLSS